MILLDNNLLTELPNFLFKLPALKVVSFSDNLLLPEQQQTKPVFSPNEESLKEIIETVKITESPGCNEHQGGTESPYEEIAVDDTNHIQPLKGFQSCSRCVSDILNNFQRSNVRNEKKKTELQAKKKEFKLRNSKIIESDFTISKNIKNDYEKKDGKISIEIIKISWEFLKYSTVAFTCYYKLKSK